MTDVLEGFRSYVIADATVSGLIGSRMYYAKSPQSPTAPYVTFHLIGLDKQVTTDGPVDLEGTTIQVDVWDNNPVGMASVYDAVRNRILAYSGDMGGVDVQGIFLVRVNDLYDNDAELYRRTADFSVWNEGT